MFQFRIGGVNSNCFYLSSRGEDARYVFDLLMEHIKGDEVNEKSKGIYIVDRDAAHAAMMQSMADGDLPAERLSHRAEASKKEIMRVAHLWSDANGILFEAEKAMEDRKDLILEVWDTDEEWASQMGRIMEECAERKREEKFRKLYVKFYRRAEESEEWAESMAERARDRQREIEKAWHKRFGCECGLRRITCTHEGNPDSE